jgi:hypothetical protein
MDLDDALRRYGQNCFTDDDVSRGTGLSVRAWRELIKVGAVRTVTERRGPGRVRLCEANVFKRAAVIAALNRTGLSLAVSGRIAYFVPFHTVLYEICDPGRILFQTSTDVDPETGLRPRVKQPRVNWFDANTPAEADPQTDWLIDVYENRFVGVRYRAEDEPAMFGDLRRERTSFVAWLPLHPRAHFMRSAIAELAKERLPSSNRFVDFVVEWEDPTKGSKELGRLGYGFEKHDTNDDPLRMAAEAAVRSPVVATTINITLAIRKALRRYLGIEPAAPGYEMGESR